MASDAIHPNLVRRAVVVGEHDAHRLLSLLSLEENCVAAGKQSIR